MFDEKIFYVINEQIKTIQGHSFVSFSGINNPNETNIVIIQFSDYHNILKSIYSTKPNSFQLITILESSPYLLFSLLDSYEIEFYEDSLLNIGIIGTNQSNYEKLIESIKKSNLNNLVWENADKYLEYIHHQFNDEHKYKSFKETFLKNYTLITQ